MLYAVYYFLRLLSFTLCHIIFSELSGCLLLKPRVVLVGESNDIGKYASVLQEEATDNIVLVVSVCGGGRGASN